MIPPSVLKASCCCSAVAASASAASDDKLAAPEVPGFPRRRSTGNSREIPTPGERNLHLWESHGKPQVKLEIAYTESIRIQSDQTQTAELHSPQPLRWLSKHRSHPWLYSRHLPPTVMAFHKGVYSPTCLSNTAGIMQSVEYIISQESYAMFCYVIVVKHYWFSTPDSWTTWLFQQFKLYLYLFRSWFSISRWRYHEVPL